jgi:hypothetical protein
MHYNSTKQPFTQLVTQAQIDKITTSNKTVQFTSDNINDMFLFTEQSCNFAMQILNEYKK